MAKQSLTDRGIKALKPARAGETYDVWDALVPGLGLRVSDRGRRTFVLIARFGGRKNPTRRALGVYNALTLEAARIKAREWIELLQRGVDPADVLSKARIAEQQKRANSFSAVAEDFIAQKLTRERKGKEITQDIRRTFVLASRPIVEITELEVLSVINNVKRQGKLAQARNDLGTAKRLFSWAVDQRVYGLDSSPVERLRPTKIVGEKVPRTRVLDDVELTALWRAASEWRYPYGPIYQLLILTALRLNEVVDASWKEFDFHNRVWTIPAERMKGRENKARAHAVPITREITEILNHLPRFTKGDYLFSTTLGETPTWVTGKIKRAIDERVLNCMDELASTKTPTQAPGLKHWTNHDIRRTVRSQLSRLKISEEAREAVLAHARPGIKGTYDHHDYLDEKREALELWAARLRTFVEPTPSNVVPLVAMPMQETA
jgi:integrase